MSKPSNGQLNIKAHNPRSRGTVFKISEYFQTVVLIIVLLTVGLYRGGMVDMTLPLLMVAAWLILATHVVKQFCVQGHTGPSKQLDARLWFTPWLVISIACAIHYFYKMPIVANWLFDLYQVPIFPYELDGYGAEPLGELKRQTRNSWAFFTVFWMISFTVSQFSGNQIKQLLWAVVAAGIFQAVTGIYLLQAGSTDVLGLWTKTSYLGDATGTFVNRNHYANFLAICLVLGAAGFMGRTSMLLPKSKLLSYGLGVSYVMLILAAILSSHSRMGLFVALMAMMVWLVGRETHQRFFKKRRWVVPLASISLLIIMMLWFGVGETLQRFLELEDNPDGRWQIWRNLSQLPISAWIWGVGPGNFADVYALIKPANSKHAFSFAHNDYLEFLVEYGVVCVSLFALTVAYFVFKLKPKAVLAQRSTIWLSALAALLAVALHSVVDFNLRIPANMVLTAIILGLFMNRNIKTNHRRRL